MGAFLQTAAFYTLGCKVNQYETEAMAELFEAAGYRIVPFAEPADIYVINTCTVTNLSDRKSRQIIRRGHKQNPQAKIIVCGCYAQTKPEEISKIDGVSLVCGTKDRNRLLEFLNSLEGNQPLNTVTSIMDATVYEPMRLSSFSGRTRAFLKIQEGCQQYCTYCIIPYARGKIRSRPEDEVLSEAKRLAKNGFREIVLTGIHLASYGKDLGNTSLLSILQKLHRIEGIWRIRLGSLEPNGIDEQFITALPGLSKLCPHFHIALQSGSEAILRRMNRKYTKSAYQNFVESVRKCCQNAAITTDIMVGFPGETDEEFTESLAFVEQIGFSQIHVFPYSRREGTPAASYPNQVPDSVKEERAKRMLALANRSHEAYLNSFVGQELEVLFERKTTDGLWEGHSPNYIKVFVESGKQLENMVYPVGIEKKEEGSLFGVLLKQ